MSPARWAVGVGVLGLAGAGTLAVLAPPEAVRAPEGRPEPATVGRASPRAPGASAGTGPGADRPADARTAVLYRWVDASGEVHVESRPPPAGVTPEVIDPTPAAPTTPAPVGAPAPRPPAPRAAAPADLARRPLSVYTPEGLRALSRELEQTRRTLDGRDRLLDELGRELAP